MRQQWRIGSWGQRREFVVVGPHRLEGAELSAQSGIHEPQGFDQRLEIGARYERGAMTLWSRHQTQVRACHDPQRAFCADEQVLEVVAGVVLEHAIHGRQHRAVGENRLDAEDVVAHHSVAHHPHPARVGGDVAPDRCGGTTTEVHREHQTSLVGSFLGSLHRHPGLNTQGAAQNVDIFDLGHRFHRKDDVRRRGSSPVDQPGAASVRNDDLTSRVAQPHDARGLIGVFRANEDLGVDYAREGVP